MSFRGLHRPGQGFKPFKVMKRESGTTQTGRPYTGDYVPMGTIMGAFSKTDPREIEQWKQRGHPVTHTIIQRGTKDNAVETDVLELEERTGDRTYTRRFLVRSARDVGGLGHFIVYKVEERNDLQ